MNIQKLKFDHFRNYEKASFSFEPGSINVLKGKNAQGKTNVIEGIYYLSHLRSFRTSSASDLAGFGTNFFTIDAEVENNQRREVLKVVAGGKKKNLYRFSKPVQKFSSFIGLCNAVLFSPDDLMLFSSSPKDRRKFIDIEMMKLDKSYTCELSEFQKLLKLRNAALKAEHPDYSLISVYTEKMSELQASIIVKRREFLSELMNFARELYPFFTEQKETLSADYVTFTKGSENLKDEILQIYYDDAKHDMMTRTTSKGIHKDDILFKLNGMPVNRTASQGQKRSFLLALKLALCQMIYSKSGQYPILLLDDVFSELDKTRRQQLISKLPDTMQIFITATDSTELEDFDRPVSTYIVENGTVRKEETEREL